MSWGDILSTELSVDYRVTNILNEKIKGENYYHLILVPNDNGMYARMDIWVEKNTYMTLKENIIMLLVKCLSILLLKML
ncbi:MAG: outer membrane lipoprotein-sorting protein [Ignavibacteria bacterium]|nr:outer membrane lipoprotein-sorting protein [Ignavibacteria bacterium]